MGRPEQLRVHVPVVGKSNRVNRRRPRLSPPLKAPEAPAAASTVVHPPSKPDDEKQIEIALSELNSHLSDQGLNSPKCPKDSEAFEKSAIQLRGMIANFNPKDM